MKKFLISLVLCFVFAFSGCNIVENPITKISVDIESQTLLVGESINFNVSTLPINTDENVTIHSTNAPIADVTENKITAKTVGETGIYFRSESGNISKRIVIRVVEQIEDYISFRNAHSLEIARSQVRVYCRSFNRNWLGIDTDVKTKSGFGTIVNVVGYTTYFVTDKSILESPADRDYEEWYLTDYKGTRYDIPGIKAHKETKVAIGSFTSTDVENYHIIPISEADVYYNDYAILPSTTLLTRVSKSPSSSYFYINSITSERLGYAVLNEKCELIGIATNAEENQMKVIGSSIIMQIYDELFN